MKKTCLTLVVLYALFALGMYAWFAAGSRVPIPGVLPEPGSIVSRPGLMLVGALVGALLPLFAYGAIDSAVARLRERAGLRRAAEGTRPPDGRHGVIHGRILRQGPSLTAPLSQRACVLYRYEIAHLESQKSVRKDGPSPPSKKIVDAEGFALTPSVVQTAAGLVKLLTLVKLEFPAETFTYDQVAENFADYAKTATFRGHGSLEDDDRALAAVLKSRDGAIRYDRGRGRLDPGIGYLIEEHIVANGEEVGVFGRYSSAEDAVVHDPESLVGVPTRLRKGSPESMSGQLALNAFGYGIAAAVCATLTAAWAITFPTLASSLW